jgi:hypothetical protein
VAAQVGREDPVLPYKRVRDGVPVAGVVAAAVDEEQRRLRFVAPDSVVEPEALRVVVAGRGFYGGLRSFLATD